MHKYELDMLLSYISKFSEDNGIGIKEIEALIPLDLGRRTLQRRISALIKTKQLMSTGQGKSIRYKVSEPTHSYLVKEEGYVPIRSESNEIKQTIRQPVRERKPVSYHREFLDNYLPNVTEYLPVKIKKHLEMMGSSVEDGKRPAGTLAESILNRLLIDLSWNSSRLEGNTYSLLETERLLEQGEMAEGKAAFESQMILNHKYAIEFLVHNIEQINFNRYTLLNLHALLANNLLIDPRACGRLRATPVGIHKTVFYPLAQPQLIEECFQKILNKAELIVNPFEQSFFILVHIPYLQPFEDVNKRVSRLASNIPFIRNNLSPLSFVDVSEQAYIDGILGVYELNRIELLRDVFVWAYERSSARYSAACQSIGEPDLFRMRYRTLIASIISTVIQDRLNKKSADIFIKKQAELFIVEKDRAQLVTVVETELNALHEGNIARYRIYPQEFSAWHENWR